MIDTFDHYKIMPGFANVIKYYMELNSISYEYPSIVKIKECLTPPIKTRSYNVKLKHITTQIDIINHQSHNTIEKIRKIADLYYTLQLPEYRQLYNNYRSILYNTVGTHIIEICGWLSQSVKNSDTKNNLNQILPDFVYLIDYYIINSSKYN